MALTPIKNRAFEVARPLHDDRSNVVAYGPGSIVAPPGHAHEMPAFGTMCVEVTLVGLDEGVTDAAGQLEVGRGDHDLVGSLLESRDPLHRMLVPLQRLHVAGEPDDLARLRGEEFGGERQLAGRIVVVAAMTCRTPLPVCIGQCMVDARLR